MANEDLGDEFQTYMLVMAHPDDSEFSSAGTVARLKDAGKCVADPGDIRRPGQPGRQR